MATTVDQLSQLELTSLRQNIEPVRSQLEHHEIYRRIKTLRDLRIFQQSHVFAVWDFMSLLKALQRQLSCVAVPWLPSEYPESCRLVNDIVLGEESDEFGGSYTSHFELYGRAMREAGADCRPIDNFISYLRAGTSWESALENSHAPAEAADFVRQTFRTIESGQPHVIAAAFTFGREDLIPDMFRTIVRDLRNELPALNLFAYYLDRHIEVDGDVHGPMSLRMVSDLCGTDARRWTEATAAAKAALRARLSLWDGILRRIA